MLLHVSDALRGGAGDLCVEECLERNTSKREASENMDLPRPGLGRGFFVEGYDLSLPTLARATIDELSEHFSQAPAETILEWALDEFRGRIGYACSFGAEGMVLIDMLSRNRQPPAIFTIDTGRLPQQTHDLIQVVRQRYGLTIHVYAPQTATVQELVSLRGPNSFYDSVARRKECCHIRKVEPLERALRGLDAWITGLRRDQTPARTRIRKIGRDPRHGDIVKVMPLADWTVEDVWTYIRANDVPYNALHDSGHPSIGCAPCTRAVAAGEDNRSGRWWWETETVKECGLHFTGWDGNGTALHAKGP